MLKQAEIHQDDIYSLEAEAGVLGSLILGGKKNPALIGEVMGKLNTEDFYLPEHQAIYDAVCDVYIKSSILDPVLLREKLKQGRQLDEVGGVDEYLVEIIEKLTSAANLDYFVEIVKRKAKNREVIKAGEAIRKLANTSEQPDEKIQQIQELASALTPIENNKEVYPVEEIAQEGLDDLLENSSGIKTGFERLDWHIGGLQKGDMAVVAARPSMGKTAFATDLALNMARDGRSVVIYSLEMTRLQIVQRMICNIARVDMHKIRQRNYTDDDIRELNAAKETLSKYNILIMKYSQLTPATFRASLKNVQHRFGADCVIIDYLQLMEVKGKTESRQQEITKISRCLKAAAKGEELPLVVLSQLNREVEHRTSHKPQLSDLRESGSIEQDADVVILLHRPDWYHRGEADYTKTNNGIFQVAKSRNGPTGELELQFNKKYVSFGNISSTTDEWKGFDKWNQ
jgi:replicative DNA helicase